jgi:hypothetical protein
VSWVPLVLVTFVFAPDQLIAVVAIMAAGWLLMQNVLAIAGPPGAVFGVPILAALASVFVAWLDHVHPEGALPPPPDEIELEAA